MGIDDYIVKPVEMKELVFRIEAILRRANITNKKKIATILFFFISTPIVTKFY